MKGSVWKFGKDINTDLIIPARYLNVSDMNELAKHCMEDADPEFVHKIQAGDMIVAEENFGCGSSREHAPSCIKAAGIACVIAKSFARIFYRNAINVGLPILECPEAVDDILAGDILEISLEKGQIYNTTRNVVYHVSPFPAFLQNIINNEGLIPYIRKKVQKNAQNYYLTR